MDLGAPWPLPGLLARSLSLLLSSSEGIGWERVVAKAVGERVEAMAGGEVDVGWRRRSRTGRREGDETVALSKIENFTGPTSKEKLMAALFSMSRAAR